MTSCYKFPAKFQDYLTLTTKFGLGFFFFFFPLSANGRDGKKSYIIYAAQTLQTNFSKNTVF